MLKANKIRNSFSLILLAVLFTNISEFNHAWADDSGQNKKNIQSNASTESSPKQSPQTVKQPTESKASTKNNKSISDK